MPTRLKLCYKSGCQKRTEFTYCDEHTPKSEPWVESGTFYSCAPWRKLRKHKLTETPLCENCRKTGEIKAAKVVDHIKPRRTHPELELEPDNLQSLCESCHNAKSGRS